jgi:hypothetical protein
VHVFRPRVSFLAEAQPRLKTKRGQKALFDRDAHCIFQATAGITKQKTSLEKLQIYFVSTFFK